MNQINRTTLSRCAAARTVIASLYRPAVRHAFAHARSLRCTYTAEAVTSYGIGGRTIKTEYDEYTVIYDNINVERGTARVIDRNFAGDLTVKWQPNSFGSGLWFIETAPAGNLLLTSVFARYAAGTEEFIALESRQSVYVLVSGSMVSGRCRVLN